MPVITAPLIHNGHHFLPQGTALELTGDGRITAILDHAPDTAVHYKGMIAPGFVNAHCHLELSHMKGMIPEHTGLIPFLQQVTFRRNDFSEEQKKVTRHEAYRELIRNGVVAVGDIANGTDTLDLRQLDELHVHTFVECIGFTETHAPQRLAHSVQVRQDFAQQMPRQKRLAQSIVPHAPYSVSEALFRLINAHEQAALMSIHNQETSAENEFYRDAGGAVNTLLQGFGIDASFFRPSGKNSVMTYGEWLSQGRSLLFVHNTFTSAEDVGYVVQRFPNASWCLCPNANLYIEDRLPDLELLVRSGMNLCIGTDSLASNHGLSILAELNILHKHFPAVGWESLLRWATFGGAAALGMQDIAGHFSTGLQPGILHILPGETEVARLY